MATINDRAALLEPGWPKMAFVEHRLAGDPTNWWALETYLCEPDPERPSSMTTWNEGEYRAATGT